jgi:pimeloyl-ACP methyl ester carboxylesterase
VAEEPQDAAAGWAYSDTGAGDAIVLVHGLGTDSDAWDRVAPQLAESYRVIAVDLPGYSLRSVVDAVPPAIDLAAGLDALLARLDIESAVLVGHSFGGAVCLLAARHHPGRCAGLVLLAPGGFGTDLNPLLPLVRTRVGARLVRSLYGPRAARTIARLGARMEARPEQSTRRENRVRVAELLETYDRLRTEQARRQFRVSVAESLALNSAADRAEYAKIDRRIPILILWGTEDRVLPPWHATTAGTLLPWSVVRMLDGIGHTPHRSHPELIADEVLAFAASEAVRHRVSPSAG